MTPLLRRFDRVAASLLARLLELNPAAQRAFVAAVRREFAEGGGDDKKG